MLALDRDDALEHEVVLGGDLGPPAVLDHDGLVRLDDDGGAAHLVAGCKLLAGVDRGVVPLPAGKKRVTRAGEGRAALVAARTGSVNLAPPPTASTDTASTTSSFASSMKPKRDLCAASNAPLHRAAR